MELLMCITNMYGKFGQNDFKIKSFKGHLYGLRSLIVEYLLCNLNLKVILFNNKTKFVS